MNLAQAGFLFGMAPEEAADCWKELKRAVEHATFHGALEKSNRMRHEAPPSSILSFMAKKREKNMKEMEMGDEMEEEEDTADAEQKKIIQRRLIIDEASKRKDPAYGPVYIHPADRAAAASRRGQQTANRSATVQQAKQTRNEHASKPDTQRLPSIHELQPFEPQTYVFNLPGQFSIRFGPGGVSPAGTLPASSASRTPQPLMAGGRQQQPRMTAGLQIPDINRNMSMLDPFGARSLSNTAALALSTPASNVNTTGDFNRGTKAGADFTSTGGQTATGNATGTAASAIGQFRGTAQPKNKSKRVRTESETESEDDTIKG